MHKLTRTIIFLSSILIFATIFAWYVNPELAWYERTLARFLGHTLLKIQIFNTGYAFMFKNKFLSDDEIIKAFFTSPEYMSVILYYVPMLILASNILLLISTLMDNLRLSLFSSIGLLTLIIFMSLSINLLVKEDVFYPIRIATPTLLALIGAFFGLSASLFSSSKR